MNSTVCLQSHTENLSEAYHSSAPPLLLTLPALLCIKDYKKCSSFYLIPTERGSYDGSVWEQTQTAQ